MLKTLVIVAQSTRQPGAKRLYHEAATMGYRASINTVQTSEECESLKQASYILFRVGPKSFGYLRDQLAARITGTYAHAELLRVLAAYDKVMSAEILADARIATPVTKVIRAIGDIEPSDTYVLKDPHGNQGMGVHLVSTPQEGVNITSVILSNSAYCIQQEYIAESQGADKRLFVVGDRVAGAIVRKAKQGEFRSNLHLGARADKYLPAQAEVDLAVEATRAHGLRFAGVDIIDSDRGSLVLEVNPSPGFGIEDVIGTNIARSVVEEIMR